jgi:PAS domain S-box-containing protein
VSAPSGPATDPGRGPSSAEEALRASEARYRGIVERIRDGILVHDGARILYANPAAERALGCTESGGLVGVAVLDLVAPEFRARVAGRIGRVLAEGLPSEPAEITLLRRDGSRLEVEVFGVPAVHDGRLAIQAVFRPIDERVRRRAGELAVSHAQLRQTERLAVIGTLAAGIAHEINNPAGAILLAAKNALSYLGRPGGEEVAGRCLRDIVRSARRCGQIVRSVLQLARQEPLERWEGDLNDSVRHAVELAQPYARTRGALVELRAEADLPPAVFNPLGIEQVVVNLIRNACEAGSGAGVWVRVSTRRCERGVQICVRDNGRGLTREEIEQVFDPFFTTRREEGGTGLGLSVAHGIVVQHGGTIWVESEPGKGCQITVELPLTSVSSPA